MKKILLFLLLLTLLYNSYSFSINDISHYDFDTFNCNELEENQISACENTKNFIIGCYENPNNCDCSYFSEDDAKKECQKWVDQGIQLMSQKSSECMKDIYACDCKTLPHPRLVSVCEKEKNMIIGKIKAMEQDCFNDLSTCDCSIFENPSYVNKCKEEIGKANEISQSCREDINNCDCSAITNPIGKAKCKENKEFYSNYENEFKTKCENNYDECDCSTIPDLNAQKICEKQKINVKLNAENQIYTLLYNCFKDINNCDCSNLPNQNYSDYCEETKSYGFACMQTGELGCEQLDNIVLYPPSLPEFLKPYFAKTFKSFIDAEKLKGVTSASDIATKCVIDPENCDCSSIPTYAREFCLNKKEMQLTCINGNITACKILDKTINVVPLSAPKFVRDFLDPILRPLMLLQKEQIKGKYAKQVKEQMLSCIKDENNCDCETVPLQYQNFCNEKISLVKKCKEKDYESCFKLMDESNIPDDIPGFIRIFVESSVNNQVNQKMNEVFLKIRPSVCETKNLKECRKYYDDNCKGLSVNECLKLI